MPTSRSNKPAIVLTMGDPAGVGPEVALKALANPKVQGLANFFLVGDGFVIDKVCKDLRIELKANLVDLANVSPATFSYGRPDPIFGKAAIEYTDKALDLIKKKEAGSLVTAPINKASVRAAGFSDFEGHTEYLAQRTQTRNYAMMFVGEDLKVTLVTRHIALKDVPGSVTVEAVYNVIALTHKYLKDYFKISNPRIGVSGLNPHAGEGGAFGDEEIKAISPAIQRAAKDFKAVTGPIPADIIFRDALDKKFDAVIAMYHDQGLAPFKMLYFKNGVNMTLGLPFVRTSPDHGTAFNIAGKGIADPGSMIEAIRLACRLAPC